MVFIIALWGFAIILSLPHFRKDNKRDIQDVFFYKHNWTIWFAVFAATVVILIPKVISNLLWPFRNHQFVRPMYFILYFLFQGLLALGFLLFFRKVIMKSFSTLGLSEDGLGIRFVFGLRWVTGYLIINHILSYGAIWNKNPEELENYFLKAFEGNVVQFLITSFQTYLGTWSLWMPIMVIVIFGPFVEEFAFRGLLYGPMRQKVGRIMAILISSLLFTLMHGNFYLTHFLAGLLFVYLYECTHSLWVPIVAHGLVNLDATIFYFISKVLRHGANAKMMSAYLLIFLVSVLVVTEILYRRMLKSESLKAI